MKKSGLLKAFVLACIALPMFIACSNSTDDGNSGNGIVSKFVNDTQTIFFYGDNTFKVVELQDDLSASQSSVSRAAKQVEVEIMSGTYTGDPNSTEATTTVKLTIKNSTLENPPAEITLTIKTTATGISLESDDPSIKDSEKRNDTEAESFYPVKELDPALIGTWDGNVSIKQEVDIDDSGVPEEYQSEVSKITFEVSGYFVMRVADDFSLSRTLGKGYVQRETIVFKSKLDDEYAQIVKSYGYTTKDNKTFVLEKILKEDATAAYWKLKILDDGKCWLVGKYNEYPEHPIRMNLSKTKTQFCIGSNADAPIATLKKK